MLPHTYLAFTLAVTCWHHVTALNILAIASLPLKSHYMAFGPLFRELANRGHMVTVINNYPDVVPMNNLTFINLSSHMPFKNGTSAMEYYEHIDSNILRIINVYRHVALGPHSARVDCENFFKHKDVLDHLALGVKYDVIFVEQFMSDCGLAYAATMYDAPIIGITSHVLLPWTYPRMGIPFDFAADAFYFSSEGPNPSLYHKVEAKLMNWYLTMYGKWIVHRSIANVFKEFYPSVSLDIDKITKERMKMVFSYQHFSLTGTRLLSPQILEIGGLHIREPKPLSEKLEEFLATAEHGAIYVSFGSNLKTSSMSRERLQQFLDAFKQIPQKVVWKWEDGPLPGHNANVFTQAWLPQVDVLCHPKILAFVSHGGMLSLSETAYCGKPLVTIPFFGDQFSNGAAANKLGFGKTIFFNNVNTENLVATIKELTSKKMQDAAKKVKAKWHDRPQPVMESAIFWTEYVARHRDSPAHHPSLDVTWFDDLQLDVTAVIIALFIALLIVLYIVLRIVLKIIIYLIFHRAVKKKEKSQ
ncbi:UDP-glycosyltransferase UGT5-like [Epargyreus clarus]|uniref:UDP-glycosyltransferase UGT5-like n=1 Tax=Epargyreus clarus TaxID=520877 RepID=UPI003C2E2A7D